MQPYRKEKLRREILRETAQLLHKEMQDPRLGFASVTKVELSPDFRYGRIYVSVLGGDKEKRGTMAALRRATGFVQKELSHRIRLRTFPEISFVLDESMEKAFEISKMLDDLAAEREAREQRTGES